ncbi:MAG: extracellular solute-binding protein [Ruminococcaceae bacterium]|nr:extracellular solute-binding protein [Oscillospiraceae bacterium]
MRKFSGKKIVALLMAALMLVSVFAFASCGEKNPPANTDVTTDNGDVTTEAPVTTEPVTTEILPEVYEGADFEDYECNILLGLTTLGRNEFKTEESSSVFSNAIYLRALKMEEDYGVLFSTEEHFTGGFSANTTLAREYSAGDTNYDFTIARSYDVSKLTVNGHLYDLMELDNLDPSKPWWDQTVVKDSTIAGSLYFASGDISTLVNDFVCCIAFNKEMFKEAIGQDTQVLYQLVDNGEWTLDKLNEYSAYVSEDLNNDEVLDSRDKYGLTVWDSRVIATVHGSGGKVVSLDEDGYLTLTLNTERNMTGVSKFIEICMHDYVLNMVGMKGGVDWKTIFINKQALFTMSSFNSLDYFRNLDTDYGILPQPKSFADQESYYSSIVSTHACFFAVPTLQEDAGRTGAIAELLGYLGKSTLTPAYYDKTLNGTHIRDEESAGSIKICFDTKVVDLGDYFSVGSYYSQLAALLNNKQPDGFASMYEKFKNSADAQIKNINTQVDALKANND